jgi:hypothetical protein
MTPKGNRGGKREGAGRKPSGKRKRNYYVTDQEHEQIKKLIEQLRKQLIRADLNKEETE